MRGVLIAILVLCGLLAGPARSAPPVKLRVLIVDGVNNHDWPTTTATLTDLLRNSKRFEVTVSTSPPRDAPAEAWARWRPRFAGHDVVLSNFNGGDQANAIMWPDGVRRAFETYVRKGGGFVSFHAANNAFPGWTAYEEMVGLLWRDKNFGPSVYFGDAEQRVVVPTNEGRNPGHGPRHDFTITTLPTNHPITRGFPRQWRHVSEQLTHGQHGHDTVVRGNAITYLSYAWSKDSRAREPMDWVRRYGRGRIYVTMLGHSWTGENNPNLQSPGFKALLLRGVEWAASGRVTLPPPSLTETRTGRALQTISVSDPAG
ncbi:MAG: ThuA domain-containing protein [Sphingomicrobium sp.]